MADSAGTVNCLMCGAAARTGATHCEHCGARLATVACPQCFGMIFQGSKFCSHCGAAVERREKELSGMECPNCKTTLKYLWLGKIEVAECEKCDGLWLENSAFETLCADREQMAAVLGIAVPIPVAVPRTKVKYIDCPLCAMLMDRHNFAGCSGVVIDVCRTHGAWFDRDELQRIIAFIRAGGLDRAREKQKREFEEERIRLAAERARGELQSMPDNEHRSHGPYGDILVALGEAVVSVFGPR